MATTSITEDVATNSSIVYDNIESQPEHKLEKISKWLFIIVIPFITIIGVIGNILIHFTMRKRGKPTSVSVYMSALALADSTVLILDFLNNWMEDALGVDLLKNKGFCIFHRYFFNVAYTYATWLIVSISIERFIVVWLPLKVNIATLSICLHLKISVLFSCKNKHFLITLFKHV